MSRLITPDNKLFITFKTEDNGECSVYSDRHIEKICRQYLDDVTVGNGAYFDTAQELVWSMFRALLYKEYEAYQHKVEFYIDDCSIKFNDKMRMSACPDSVWHNTLCILLGATDE